MSSTVTLRLYDLSHGLAATIGRLFGVEAIWHTGVLVHGFEIFYGGGIVKATPEIVEREYQMRPLKILEMGVTQRTMDEIDEWITRNNDEFNERNYRIIEHNCNHFADAFVRFLMADGSGIPDYIVKQHEVVAKLPIGKFILEQITRFEENVPKPFAWSSTPGPFEKSLKALWEDKGVSEEKKEKAVKLLRKIAHKVTSNATVPEYRTVKSSSATLTHDLLDVKGATECLVNMGFEQHPGESCSEFTISQVNAEVLQRLNQYVKLMDQVIDLLTIQAPRSSSGGMPALIPTMPGAGGRLLPGLFGGNNNGNNNTGSNDDRQYATQTETLFNMGFSDPAAVARALRESNGNINGAIDKLTK